MSRQRIILLTLLLVLLPGFAGAAPAQFESEVVVTDQSPAVRSTAMRTALGEVLVRVTGQPGVTASAAASGMLASPERLVQQYRYFTESGQEPALLKLWVRFDGDAIRDALQQQGVGYWGGERPDTLAWLMVDDQGSRFMVSADDDSALHREMVSAARAHGVALIFPLMDLEDQASVRFADLWAGNTGTTAAAAGRYQAPSQLFGRFSRTASGGWAVRWQVQTASGNREWSDSHPQLEQLVRQGMDDIADVQTALLQSGVSAAADNGTDLTVAGITSLADYARTGNYLASLSAVRAVQVAQVTPNSVRYRLDLASSAEDLLRTVAIGSVLQPAGDGIAGSYRLRQ